MFYFAYGSNINKEHFSKFCPVASKTYQHAVLLDHKIEFQTIPSATQWKAFATIEKSEGHHVHGILYHIEHLVEQTNLNRKEGLHLQWYQKKNVNVVLNGDNETEINCFTYVMKNGNRDLNTPSTRYSNLFKKHHDRLVQSCLLHQPPLNRRTRCSVLSF